MVYAEDCILSGSGEGVFGIKYSQILRRSKDANPLEFTE